MFKSLLNIFVPQSSSSSESIEDRWIDDVLEDSWVNTKAKILITSPYKNSKEYSSLYYQSQNILQKIIFRHEYLILEAESISSFKQYIDNDLIDGDDHGIRMVGQSIIGQGNFETIQSEVLVGLIILAYIGGSTRTSGGTVIQSPNFVISATDYLLYKKKLPIALFIKGLVLKYGLSYFSPPNILGAKKFLTAAESCGLESATVELKYLDHHYRRLSHIKTIHTDSNGEQQWVDEAKFES